MKRATDKERETLNKGSCPKCKKRGFVLGPMGGLSLNIECANLTCRERYNVAIFSGAVQSAEHIEKRADGAPAWPSEPLQ